MEVTIISTSPKKEKEAREVLKADHFVVSKDEKQMAVRAGVLLPPSFALCALAFTHASSAKGRLFQMASCMRKDLPSVTLLLLNCCSSCWTQSPSKGTAFQIWKSKGGARARKSGLETGEPSARGADAGSGIACQMQAVVHLVRGCISPPCGQAVVGTLDGIIDTVSAQHDISALLPLLKTNGKLILLGVPPAPHSFAAGSLLFQRCACAHCVKATIIFTALNQAPFPCMRR